VRWRGKTLAAGRDGGGVSGMLVGVGLLVCAVEG
jgi:hypothetical protein